MTKITGHKGGGGSTYTPSESPDSIHSLARLRMLLALGEGEFDGLTEDELRKRVMLNGTPIRNANGTENFPTAKVEYRPGTQGQEPIAGFSAVESETGVGVKVTTTQPWTQVITNTELDAVRVRVGFPALQKQTDKGDLVGAAVKYQIAISTDNGSEKVYNYSINAKTTTLYERDHRINLPAANSNWRVTVRRQTGDSASAKIQDTIQVQSWTGIINANLRYPHTALLFIEFDAKAFQNTPAVSILARGRKVQIPSNYDPLTRTYTGDWDGTFKRAWTNNPAWHWYDICVTDRFGLGRRIKPAMLNRYAIYQIAQRCDQLVPDGKGGTEPRYSMDIYIQGKQQAWTILKDMAACFAGMSWWGGQMLNLVSDTPVAAMSHVITNANTVDGNITYATGSQATRNSTFVVNYSDPTNHYKDTPTAGQRIDLVRRYKINPIEITAIGCTRESEAQRRGHWALVSNMLDAQASFKVGLEGLFYMPGMVVPIADWRISAGAEIRGGRIVSSNGRTVITDQPITFYSGDVLLARNEAGVMQRVIIKSATTTTIDGVERGQLLLQADPGAFPAARPFVIDGGQLQTQLFRITKVKAADDGVSFDVTGVQYDESKYDAVDKGARLDQRVLTNIPDGTIPAPTKVTITGNEVLVQNKRTTDLNIAWDAVDKAVAYEVQFRRMNLQNTTIGEWATDWITVPRTAALGVDVPDVFAGNYVARVRAIGMGEISSPWTESAAVAVTGRQGGVPAPEQFTATDNQQYAVGLSWQFPADAEDTLKTTIMVSATPSDVNEMLLADVPYPSATYTQVGLKAGVILYYRARLEDRIGNVSPWTAWVKGQPSNNANDYLAGIADDLLTSEDGQRLTESIEGSLEASWQNALAGANILHSQYAQLGSVRAEILQVASTVVDVNKSLAELSTDLRAEIDKNTANISEKLTAMVDSDGASAIYTLRVGVKYNGQEVLAGMSVAAIADAAGGAPTARVAFNANEFVLLSGSGNNLFSPFAVKSGQVFINEAFIGDATISFGKITDSLRSTDYETGFKGWNLPKSGDIELNNATIRGTIYAENGYFNGTVRAERIEGDIYNFQPAPRQIGSTNVSVNDSVQYRNLYTLYGERFDRIYDTDLTFRTTVYGGYRCILDIVQTDGTILKRLYDATTANNNDATLRFSLNGMVIPATGLGEVLYLRLGYIRTSGNQSSITFDVLGTRIAASRKGATLIA